MAAKDRGTAPSKIVFPPASTRTGLIQIHQRVGEAKCQLAGVGVSMVMVCPCDVRGINFVRLHRRR